LYAFVDIDGTLVSGESAIPGAAKALSELRSCVHGLRLVTNQSKEGAGATLARLQAQGFEVGTRDIFGTLAAVRRFVDQKQLRPLFLLTDAALLEFEGVPTHEPNAVVVGTAPEDFHYERLNEAARVLLRDERSELIACNKGRYFGRNDGLSLMAGPFVAALEFATGRQAIVVGKPSRAFFEEALLDVVAGSGTGAVADAVDVEGGLARCVMIGDDAVDDVQGAMDVGMKAILVRTGKYREGDEARFRTPPLAIVDDVAAAVAFLRSEGLLEGRLGG